MRKGKKPSWIKMLVWREGEWLVLNKTTFPVKKGELIRLRGERSIYEVMEDASPDPKGGGIDFHAHKFADLIK
jgi:hypothetical protein